MRNWIIPRERAIQIVVKLARRGYPIAEVAESVTEQHYIGKSIPVAAGRLAQDAFEAFYTEYAARTLEQDRIHEMVMELEAEGWELINEPGRGFMWRHPETDNYVGNGGGLFRTLAEATKRTFTSQTRELTQSAQSS